MPVSVLWSPPLVERAPLGCALELEEWVALGEDEPGELVDGHLEEEEVPDAVHELAVTWLSALLRTWLGSTGFVLGSEIKLALANTGRKPDLSVYFPGRKPPPRRGALTEPPDIVVEVVTPTPRDERRDRVEKMAEYAQFGVRMYWIVDPALGSIEIFCLDVDRHYKALIGATSGVVDPVPGCAGLKLDVDALWAELGRLAES
jgi:Uma2 family endonuclease